MKVILGPLVLCQDCLKQKTYTAERHVGDEVCECGGDFCGCSSCNETLQALKAGKRTKEELGTQSDVLSWNENQGIKAPIECKEYYYIHKNKFLECIFISNEKLTHLPENYKSDYISEYEFMYRDQSSEMNRELIETTETESVNVAMQGIPVIFLDSHY